jgi:hypothetical protein
LQAVLDGGACRGDRKLRQSRRPVSDELLHPLELLSVSAGVCDGREKGELMKRRKWGNGTGTNGRSLLLLVVALLILLTGVENWRGEKRRSEGDGGREREKDGRRRGSGASTTMAMLSLVVVVDGEEEERDKQEQGRGREEGELEDAFLILPFSSLFSRRSARDGNYYVVLTGRKCVTRGGKESRIKKW